MNCCGIKVKRIWIFLSSLLLVSLTAVLFCVFLCECVFTFHNSHNSHIEDNRVTQVRYSAERKQSLDTVTVHLCRSWWKACCCCHLKMEAVKMKTQRSLLQLTIHKPFLVIVIILSLYVLESLWFTPSVRYLYTNSTVYSKLSHRCQVLITFHHLSLSSSPSCSVMAYTVLSWS